MRRYLLITMAALLPFLGCKSTASPQARDASRNLGTSVPLLTEAEVKQKAKRFLAAQDRMKTVRAQASQFSSSKEYHEAYKATLVEFVNEVRSWQAEQSRDPTPSEREDIEALLRQNQKQRIMQICIHPGGRAIVTTGVVRGPLDGHGSTYFLIKDEKSGWHIVHTSEWLS